MSTDTTPLRSFAEFVLRGFESGAIKSKPCMNMDPDAEQVEILSLGDMARRALAATPSRDAAREALTACIGAAADLLDEQGRWFTLTGMPVNAGAFHRRAVELRAALAVMALPEQLEGAAAGREKPNAEPVNALRNEGEGT